MVLPMIVYSREASSSELRHRKDRDWLRRLENVLSSPSRTPELEGHLDNGVLNLRNVSKELTECYSQNLWRRPDAYLRILDSIKEATLSFNKKLTANRQLATKKLNGNIISRLELYRKQWQGIETYADTTMKKLELQGNAVS